MPDHRLEKARRSLPEGYQFGDAARLPRCFTCGSREHGWMRCLTLAKKADKFMASVYADPFRFSLIDFERHGD